MLVMFYSVNIYSVSLLAQNLRLTGLIDDVNTHKPIEGVSVYALVDNRKKHLTSSNREGSFSLEYPDSGTALVIEKEGYRTLSIAAGNVEETSNANVFFVRLPLIPLDQQATDRPYMQSEQKDFTLSTQDTGKQTVTRVFKIKDALTNQFMSSAYICFEYTKTEKKDCKYITPDNPAQRVTFVETDIVSVVVEATGYQTYRGNLILDKMDGSNSIYEVKMTPEVSVFTMNVKNVSNPLICSLTPVSGKDFPLNNGPSGSYYSLTQTGDFLLKVSDAQGELLHSEKVSVQKGLNYKVVTVSKKTTVSKTKPEALAKPKLLISAANTTPLPDSTKSVILYFTQSQHTLLPDAKEKLNQLILWLHQSPDRKIKIAGHSDNVGDPRRNEVLSEYRARVTFTYLFENGIPREQMICIWMGDKKPIEKNDSEENKKKNRRVEITLLPEKTMSN